MSRLRRRTHASATVRREARRAGARIYLCATHQRVSTILNETTPGVPARGADSIFRILSIPAPREEIRQSFRGGTPARYVGFTQVYIAVVVSALLNADRAICARGEEIERVFSL